MIDIIKQTILTRDFVFVLILIGFIMLVSFLLLEGRRDNIRLKQLNQKIKDLIAGDYSQVLDMQGNSEITNITNNLNDLSEVIRLTQENLEQESKRLHSILSYMTDGVLATNRRGQITMINDMAKRQLGVENDEALNQNILELLKIEDEYELRDLITQSPELMIYSQNVNGEYISLRVRFALIRRESGFISGLVAVLHDTTEQEKEERERRLFVSNVSHELRTPLTTMNSYIEALEEGVINDKELAPQFIDTIHKETNRMIRMVNELLQLGKMDIKEEHYDKEFIDINKLIEQIATRFELTHPEKNFIKYISKTPIFVEGDQDKLTQVFDNIMNNAIKYSPNGKNITIRVRQNYNHNRVNISIKDEGVGIPLVHIDKIFNRFYRVDKSRQRSMGGTGLGLALAKNIIEAHKGRIWAQSREGYGTIIFVTLPCERIDDEWL